MYFCLNASKHSGIDFSFDFLWSIDLVSMDSFHLMEREEKKHVRNSYGGFTFGLSTLRTDVGSVIILRITNVTYVMHPAPWLFEGSVGYQFGWIDITRITVWILVEFGRFSGTFLATNMFTRETFLGTLDKVRFTDMTSTSNPLNHILTHKILATRARGHGQRYSWIARILEVRRKRESTTLARANFANLGLGNQFPFTLLFLLGGRETGTFLASWVLAIDADLLWTKGRFAAMTGSANTHSNRFGHSIQFEIPGGGLPFTRLQSQPIFGEESASLFLLHDAIVGKHGGLLGGSIGRFKSSCWGRCLRTIYSRIKTHKLAITFLS